MSRSLSSYLAASRVAAMNPQLAPKGRQHAGLDAIDLGIPQGSLRRSEGEPEGHAASSRWQLRPTVVTLDRYCLEQRGTHPLQERHYLLDCRPGAQHKRQHALRRRSRGKGREPGGGTLSGTELELKAEQRIGPGWRIGVQRTGMSDRTASRISHDPAIPFKLHRASGNRQSNRRLEVSLQVPEVEASFTGARPVAGLPAPGNHRGDVSLFFRTLFPWRCDEYRPDLKEAHIGHVVRPVFFHQAN